MCRNPSTAAPQLATNGQDTYRPLARGMSREDGDEMLDDPALPADVVAAAYRELASTHR